MTERDKGSRIHRTAALPRLAEQGTGLHTVCAELTYNPYLLHTSVKFNGQTPRVNSLIEKYQNLPLRDWVEQIPKIFYDEMNGYGFDLYFSGTKSDFLMVQQAFLKAGISSGEVCVLFRNMLEDVDIKYQEVGALLQWLKENRNRKFDYASFMDRGAELFEESYLYVIINGDVLEWPDPQVSLEPVDSTAELEALTLYNVPILFCVDDRDRFQRELLRILARRDVEHKQLFFLLHPQLSMEQIKRVIVDLGIEQPQIVASADDAAVRAYFYHAPVTKYIQLSIKAFASVIHEISAILDAEYEENKHLNAAVHTQLAELEETISKLEQCDDSFVNREDFYTPQEFWTVLSTLEGRIKKWRSRKTKVIGEQEISAAAQEYDTELKRYAVLFREKMQEEWQTARTKLYDGFHERCRTQGIEEDFNPNIPWSAPQDFEMSSILPELLAQKEVRVETRKNDFIHMLRSKEEMACVVSCSYEQWRRTAIEQIRPIAAEYLREAAGTLRAYYDALAEAFHVHLRELIAAKTRERHAVSEQLSDEERKLQEDSDWLQAFREQLDWIERG